MSWTPSVKIYEDDGATLVYTISDWIGIQGWPDNDNPGNVTLSNLRSQGEINIEGGDRAYDIIITGRLSADDYENLISAWNTLQNAIQSNTNYYLKIDTSQSTTDDIKVVRKEKIRMQNRGNLTKWLYFDLVLRANAWN
ncbi:MAG: hypothetical protein PVG65_01075 [Candidatus Thorarchaeota archaeon]|jgi:hypothetical protein